ncbi:MAG: hypothetical protein NZM11_12750, partial [Anaerolineales bacterium]|nr:hypothetical protein [Anaerolineales bacterium]
NYLEDAVYVGVIPLLLGIGTIISFFSRANSQSAIHNQKSPIPTFYFLLFLTLLLPITLLLALGRNTPVFPWLYANVPTFDMFQAPTR